MTNAVRVVTDSNTMIPWGLVDDLGIVVVPLTIVIGDRELVEDRDLDVVDAYRQLRAGAAATTSAPSPGAFAAAYEQLRGNPIVSVHIGSAFSATANVARLAGTLAGIDVRVVDTGAASFLAGCCVLAAALAAQAGADLDEVVRRADEVAVTVETVFTLTEAERAQRGGRLTGVVQAEGSVPLIRMAGGIIERVAAVATDVEAADLMFAHIVANPARLRIGVGDADAGPVVDDLVQRLRAARPADEIVRYVVGPTVAAHAGMGTFGIVFHPLVEPGEPGVP
ncbi:MAG: DegV family protein [Ilumatobacteraceae bacterium]